MGGGAAALGGGRDHALTSSPDQAAPVMRAAVHLERLKRLQTRGDENPARSESGESSALSFVRSEGLRGLQHFDPADSGRRATVPPGSGLRQRPPRRQWARPMISWSNGVDSESNNSTR
jgi:hypothetical protein